MKKSRYSKCSGRPAGLDGGSLIITIIMISVLALIAAETLSTLTERWRYGMQTNSWQEAESAAEAGADMAMAALINTTWTGWKDGNGNSVSGPPSVGATETYKTTLSHTTGEGGKYLAVIVNLDAPNGLSDASGQWYRIRSTGVSHVPGTVHIGYEPTLLYSDGTRQSHSTMLRKFSFTQDRSGGQLSLPQVARTIEIIAKPQVSSPWTGPITLNKQLTMSGGGIIDAFDSSSTTYSNSGAYSSSKRMPSSAATVNIIATGGQADLKNTYVYANIKYNGGAVANTTNVQGTVTSPSTATTTPVSKPTWTVINATPTVINGAGTLNAGSAGSPALYKVSSVNLSGSNVYRLVNPTPGQQAYISIWVTGSFQTSGSSQIQLDAGVHATYYVEGDIQLSGSSFSNLSGVAANNVIYGVTPSNGSNPQLQVSGSGTLIAAIDAPAYKVQISGGANITGALVGNTMDISGGASFHYDNALSKFGGSSSSSGNAYKVASWVEDIR